jgi:hypothetical protein
MGEQAAIAVVDGDPGFVAGALDTQHQHDYCGLF